MAGQGFQLPAFYESMASIAQAAEIALNGRRACAVQGDDHPTGDISKVSDEPNKIIYSMVRVSKFYDKNPFLKTFPCPTSTAPKSASWASTAPANLPC
jgi:hypothetical protein